MSQQSNVKIKDSGRFLEAARKGNVSEFMELLSDFENVDVKNDRGWTALMLAARNGQTSVIKSLLEKGCDVNLRNLSGHSALDIASFWNHRSAEELLQEHSASPESETFCNHFSQNPLYRATDKRTDQSWISSMIEKPSTKFIIFSSLKPFLKKTEHTNQKYFYKLALFTYNQLSFVLKQKSVVIFLGLETWDPESTAWFAVDVTGLDDDRFTDIVTDGCFVEPFPLAMQMESHEAAIFAESRSVLSWHDRYAFCATCGGTTTVCDAGYKRVCDNNNCRSHKGVHNTCHPRVDPSLIMLVVSCDGKRCLLGRKKVFPQNMYSCLAGFMEPGESLEDTCRREVKEESGVTVGRVEYHSSQPWPFPAVLMLGYITYAKTDEIQVDTQELEDARWFTRQEAAEMLTHQHPGGLFVPPCQAIAHQLIKTWVSRTSNL